MASVKIFSLVVRTLAKPIANTVKAQATEHESFRNLCINIAQRIHRTEARMRLGLLNEEAKNVKPLNDTRAVQNGATFLAESFLFAVAAGLVLGETYRSSRKETKRRDDVRERIEALEEEVQRARDLVARRDWEAELGELRERNQSLENVLSTVVSNGLKAGWLALGHGELESASSSGTSLASTSSAAAESSIGSVLPLVDPAAFKRYSDTVSPGGDDATRTIQETRTASPTATSSSLASTISTAGQSDTKGVEGGYGASEFTGSDA